MIELKNTTEGKGSFMKTFTAIGVSILLFMAVPLQAQEEAHDKGPDKAIIVKPGDIQWKDGPPSFEAGSQMAVLEGSPGESGFFNLRIKLPDGFRISPHWHPRVERVTVISGSVRLGHGEKFDREATELLNAGSYVSLPPKMVHYAVTEGETVVQLTTIGPWEIHYVNPKDDPRKR